MPMEDKKEEFFILTVELIRSGSSYAFVVGLRLHRPLQLEFEFPQ